MAIKIRIVTKDNSFSINKMEYQKGSITVNHGDPEGVSMVGISAKIEEVECDGQVFDNKDDLESWLSSKLFYKGGGDGTGSQNKGATYMGTEPLFNDDLNADYPNATDRFIVVAPNIGSGMLYIKIIVDNQGWWFSLPASLAINNQ